MKLIANLAAGLLGLAFVVFGANYYLEFLGAPPPLPEGTPGAHFWAAVGPTGFMDFVKTCEILGGLLVALPKTRNLGLLLLGPVVANILAFHYFIMDGEGLTDPIVLGVAGLTVFVILTEARAFAGLVKRPKA